MSTRRFRQAHRARARSIDSAIEALAALSPEGEFWSLLASTDPAAFLRAVAAHVKALRNELRALRGSDNPNPKETNHDHHEAQEDPRPAR